MPIVNGVYQYTEGEQVEPSFTGWLNKLGDSVRAMFASLTANDVPWTNLTLGGSITGATGSIAYSVSGTTLWLRIDLTGGSFVSGTSYTINAVASPLPTTARPTNVPAGSSAQLPLGAGYSGSVSINADGSISFVHATGSNRTAIRGEISLKLG